MRKKVDLFGILAPVGIGVVTGLVYIVGKLKGQHEAYTDCANMLREGLKNTDAVEKHD